MQFVLDCSITMSWFFQDEASKHTDAILDLLNQGEALVPAIWVYEVANVLAVAERNKRLKLAQTTQILEQLSALPIKLDEEFGTKSVSSLLLIARDQAISAYDGAYLALAVRNRLPLATADAKLHSAAKKCGIKVL